MSHAQKSMMDAMGILQHHDAVTGTSQQRVANNYAFKLFKAFMINNPVLEDIIMKIANGIDNK